ncbi:D-arabinono-1,4-lactone oxidase [Cellulomonas sp. HZM]|uniref:D-arabinono-1,4-lactone oxidase n=1 Tax=Cellulomonas sp. HZM TaxID=1454010 RepID=UPI00068EACAC|nr:D-arabinono-1,4-lactone oxidase [Cellulomonas sp. HZM]
MTKSLSGLMAGATSTTWHNWARTASATPHRSESPRDLPELQAVVREGADQHLRVRAVGAGHSFTPAAVTDGIHLHLDHLSGIEGVSRLPDGSAHVTVAAGTRLHQLNALLSAEGLAMRNLGDIDRQSVAGAISTGTHGTGARLGGISTQVVGVRLVTATGDVVEASADENPELFELGRLGLGTVGVLAAVTLHVVPAYRLEAREEPMRLLDVLDGLDDLADGNDHFEFYWFPFTDRALTKRNNRVADDVVEPLSAARAWVDDELLSNRLFSGVNRLASAVPRITPALNNLSARGLSARRYTAPSHEVFISPRRVVFREMEYAVPREHLRGVLEEIDGWLRSTSEPVPFPLEIRFAAADDLWLSTAHGRETAYVAVHQYARMPHGRYFDAVEKIFAQVDGRPHWGKMHRLGAERFAELYPRFADAQRTRAAADPTGVFANPYTDHVFGSRHTAG